MEIFGIWIAALLTLAIFSFLYKDNPFYKFAEHLFMGVSAGYWLARQYHNAIKPNLISYIKYDFQAVFANSIGFGTFLIYLALHILPGILGVLMLMRLIPKVSWVSRYAIAFIVGFSAGINFITYLQADALQQIAGSILPLTSIESVLLVFGVSCALIYFFFSVEHKGAVGGIAKVGVWLLMLSFGASFGYTIMARVSLLIGRIQFLLGDWLKLLKPDTADIMKMGFIALVIALFVVLGIFAAKEKKEGIPQHS